MVDGLSGLSGARVQKLASVKIWVYKNNTQTRGFLQAIFQFKVPIQVLSPNSQIPSDPDFGSLDFGLSLTRSERSNKFAFLQS